MTEKDTGTKGKHFVNLDIGAPLKKAGITFPQGEPKAVPEMWVEDFERDPNFASVDAPSKKHTPGECENRRTAEMKTATARRDAWRRERKAGKKTPAVPNAPPEPTVKKEVSK